jgi:hypothetical protein
MGRAMKTYLIISGSSQKAFPGNSCFKQQGKNRGTSLSTETDKFDSVDDFSEN